MAVVERTVVYRCSNDCVQSGCPGHELRLMYYSITDSYVFSWVGEKQMHLERGELDAMLALLELLGRADSAKPLTPNTRFSGGADTPDERGND